MQEIILDKIRLNLEVSGLAKSVNDREQGMGVFLDHQILVSAFDFPGFGSADDMYIHFVLRVFLYGQYGAGTGGSLNVEFVH